MHGVTNIQPAPTTRQDEQLALSFELLVNQELVQAVCRYYSATPPRATQASPPCRPKGVPLNWKCRNTTKGDASVPTLLLTAPAPTRPGTL